MTNSPLSRPSAAAMGQSLPGKPQTFLPAWMILQEARRNRWPSLEASIGPSSNPLLRSFGFGKKGLWLPFDFKAGLGQGFPLPPKETLFISSWHRNRFFVPLNVPAGTFLDLSILK